MTASVLRRGLAGLVEVVQRFFGSLLLRRVSPKKRTVLITGCDKGIGHALCGLLARERGVTIVATCLTNEGRARLRNLQASGSLHIIVGDITDQAHVEECVMLVQRVCGGALDALVNNAGVARGSFVDWTSLQDFREAMEVNFFGLVGITKAMLPMVIQGRGRVINVSSVTGVEGLGTLPTQAAYVCSKHAVEAFSRCLRAECQLFGVQVITVNPGFTRTALVEGTLTRIQRLWTNVEPAVRRRWGNAFVAQYMSRVLWGSRIGGPAESVARALEHAVLSPHPRRRYWVGWDALLVFYPLTFAPDWVVDKLLSIPLTWGMPRARAMSAPAADGVCDVASALADTAE